MRTYKIEGIVLKRRNFGEADRVLTVLSKESGKIQVKAPGVRRIPSRRSSHVELLNLSEFTLYSGSRSFMPIVTEAETLEDFSLIKNTLEKISYAYYICELINSFCPDNQENRRAFFLFKEVLLNLEQEKNPNQLISYFEKELLRILGFWKESNLLETQDSRIVIEKLLERKLKTLRAFPFITS